MAALSQESFSWDIAIECGIVCPADIDCDCGRLPGVLRLLHGQFGANPLL
jgi:hypothetical protein